MKRNHISKMFKYGLGGVSAVLILAQFVPVDRANPPVESELEAPSEVLAVLRRSCYDCHSNETSWPWYSKVAPASWLVAKDVKEGREAVNYSIWGAYSPEQRAEKREETWEDVEEGEMPLAIYTLAHPAARLTTADRETLRAWALDAVHTGVNRTEADDEKHR